MSVSRRAIITTTEEVALEGVGGLVERGGGFSSVISAIENCGVIVHSNDWLINGGEPPPPLLQCVTQWGQGGGGTPEDAGGRSLLGRRVEFAGVWNQCRVQGHCSELWAPGSEVGPCHLLLRTLVPPPRCCDYLLSTISSGFEWEEQTAASVGGAQQLLVFAA